MNKMASDNYNEENRFGLYCNRYGNKKTWYDLFTKEEKCPNQPTEKEFYPSNMNKISNRE
jgi:hypothetical protein